MDTSPRSVGRYVLYGAIASGGMASVHLGRLLGGAGFARTVCIKRLHPHLAADPELVALFLDEARLAARVRHPNVVSTIDVIAEGAEVLLVMEYVPGESLAKLWRAAKGAGERAPASVAVAVMSGVLHGLHAAHEATNERGEPLGIVHRDVSPQNVLVGADGQARVLDFGIAKAVGRSQETRDGRIKGKLAYMAPEQLEGREVTRQTDVYAASIVTWELLAGERLFDGENEGELVTKVLTKAAARPSEVARDRALAPLDAIVLRGLARERRDRFGTAREMALALERAVAPATAAEVSEWVEGVAHDALARRAAEVAAIESGGAAAGVSAGVRTDDALPPTQLSGVSIATRGAGGARWTKPAAAVVALASAAALATIAVRATSHRAAPSAAAPSATSVLAATSPPPPAAPPASALEEPPLASASVSASPPPAPASSKPAPAAKPRVGVAPVRAAAPPPGCDPPYTYDAQGHKHYKPECF